MPSSSLPSSPASSAPQASQSFSESPGVKKWIENYLWVGETMMDQSVALMGTSGYFERKR
ncbi:hypothetical protein D0865_16148 [Hortaea werneckii]|uniref:Uncharacterized protein n=1 Tax=Hortaea werneckii TaxID=91943 RepID=A0A3M7AHB4_HORWE|nr:hypothetical protein D0865_16148 [Hortaea werneckii]